MLESGKPAARPAERRQLWRAMAAFAIPGVAVLVLVAVGGLVALERLGTDEAVRDARRLTQATGFGVVAPAITPNVLAGDPRALRRLDRIVRSRVLSSSVMRVKIWTSDGRIVYSDEPRLIGEHYRLGAEEVEALRRGTVSAEVGGANDPENRFERDKGKLLQVYLGLHATDGTPVLYEQYLRYGAIAATGQSVWRPFAPVMVLGLVVLAAVQIPLAWRLARRLREGQRERERLLVRAVEASEAERRSIAGGLHDGIVQELAGLSFSMAAAVERGAPETDLRRTLAAGAAGTRSAIRQLRTLLLEIYPPRLRDHGLGAALTDLASPLTARGVDVDVDLPDRDGLPPDVEQLIFRVAQEAVRNVGAHAGATHVRLAVAVDDAAATLEVRDDGRGFDAAATAERRSGGHMGLPLLSDLADAAGARLAVESRPGAGTTVRLEVPLR